MSAFMTVKHMILLARVTNICNELSTWFRECEVVRKVTLCPHNGKDHRRFNIASSWLLVGFVLFVPLYIKPHIAANPFLVEMFS